MLALALGAVLIRYSELLICTRKMFSNVVKFPRQKWQLLDFTAKKRIAENVA